ncbi:class I fructose-bisphosphate aldolase, partial [Rhizobium ruizarguesonis]
SVINAANTEGIQAVVDQQFEIGKQVLAKGMVPILEPEVTISIDDKKEAEELLKAALLKGLDDIPEGQQVMIKVSIPTVDNFYEDLIN